VICNGLRGVISNKIELNCYYFLIQQALNVFQLKDGKYQADLVIQMADDLLPKDIGTKVKDVVHKCRDAGNGKF
jgi:hypothetical protein